MARKGTRNRTQRASHTADAVELRKAGKSITEIANELGISKSQVTRDLGKVHAAWMKKRVEANKDALMIDRLSALRVLEDEYWTGWDKSQLGKTKSEAQKENTAGKQRERAKKQTETGAGDARFLDGIMAIYREEHKLLGLYAPAKVAPTDPSGEREYVGSMSDDDARRRLAQLLAAGEKARSEGADCAADAEQVGE